MRVSSHQNCTRQAWVAWPGYVDAAYECTSGLMRIRGVAVCDLPTSLRSAQLSVVCRALCGQRVFGGVQDGPIRTYSDFSMMGRIPSCSDNPSRLCPLPDFLEQVQYELHDPKWRPECFFNGSVCL